MLGKVTDPKQLRQMQYQNSNDYCLCIYHTKNENDCQYVFLKKFKKAITTKKTHEPITRGGHLFLTTLLRTVYTKNTFR